jgi:formate hydrogenlyase subunit 3/multisubunit Na+/H+ antiporter MnhD subunit
VTALLPLLEIAVVLVLLVPLGLARPFGLDLLGADWPLGAGLVVQAVVGLLLLTYLRGALAPRERGRALGGYLLAFAGLGGAYLAGRSLWLPVCWELSTLGFVLAFFSGGHRASTVRGVVVLFAASGVSMLLLAVWVFLPEGPTGLTCLALGLMLKGAFFGLHFWYAEVHAGAPNHVSAALSGAAVNLPVLLFARYVAGSAELAHHASWLVPLAGVGVFLGGLVAFFKGDVRRALAHSTVENANVLWLCLLASVFFANAGQAELAAGFRWVFYGVLVHHALSKTFQFLGLGYLYELAGSSAVERCKGAGRGSGLSAGLLAAGAASFAAMPGTVGFLAETSLLWLLGRAFGLPLAQALPVLAGLVFMLIGLVLGGSAHLRLYLPMVLSVPAQGVAADVHPAPAGVRYALGAGAAALFGLPVGVLVFLGMPASEAVPPVLRGWLLPAAATSTVIALIWAALARWRFVHRVRARVLWDCGNRYRGPELSVPSNVFSAPLEAPLARYFLREDGRARLDQKLHSALERVLNLGRYWIGAVESGAVSTYLAFSTLVLMLTAGILVLFNLL